MGDSRTLCFFIAFYQDGGAERVLFSIARELLQQGMNVDIVVCRETDALHTAIPSGAKLHLLHCHPSLSGPKLAEYARAEQPSAIYSTLIWPNVVNVITKMCYKLPYKAILREANCLPQHFAFRSWPNRLLSKWLVKRFYPKADKVICVSQEACSHLQNFLGPRAKNLINIPNPINFEQIEQLKKASCNHPWFNTKHGPVIVAAGRLKPQKGFDLLIKAITKLPPNIRLIILGEGTERASLQSLITQLKLNGRIELAGYQSNPYPYFYQADLYVLSSLHEGMPNALLDAMTCGTTIVSTNCPAGPTELLQEGKFGALVPAGDSEALADSIAQALQSPPTPDNRFDYLQQFAITTIAQTYLDAGENNVPPAPQLNASTHAATHAQ
jgi:glycosyltransferase involved in cell wall biosynthesis